MISVLLTKSRQERYGDREKRKRGRKPWRKEAEESGQQERDEMTTGHDEVFARLLSYF